MCSVCTFVQYINHNIEKDENHCEEDIESGSALTNHSQEDSLPFSPRFYRFEFNITSDWLNRMV